MIKSSKILSTGYYIPKKIITNKDFVTQGLDTTEEWITTRTGILERHICETETTSDMAFFAAENAIQNGSINTSDIDGIIVATSTPDFGGFPSVACQVQARLGLRAVPAFDISAACSGFNYALTTAHHFIRSGTSKNILVIGADALSKIVDWSDRGTCILFGDAAGAVILSETNEPGILYTELFSDGHEASILYVEDNHIKMEGKAVFKVAINTVIPAIETALNQTGLTANDITYFIPHQANTRIIEKIGSHFGFNDQKTITNIQTLGNTSAASIPTALAQHNEKSPFKSGDILLLTGFGAGFTWGITLLKWE